MVPDWLIPLRRPYFRCNTLTRLMSKYYFIESKVYHNKSKTSPRELDGVKVLSTGCSEKCAFILSTCYIWTILGGQGQVYNKKDKSAS